MLNNIIGNIDVPKYLSTDNDQLFLYSQWKANLRIYEIKEIKSVPYTPISHPFVERLIGTIRREYLDHTQFIGSNDLKNKLDEFKKYYNEHRFHLSLKSTPNEMAGKLPNKVASLDDYRWRSLSQGLFQVPIAA